MSNNKEIRFSDFSEEELRSLQLKLNEILTEFDMFCKEYGLTYFLTAGSCLGAVRHKGFIPWDDDLDVCLPRKDYERLTELWNEKHPKKDYVLCRPGKNQLTGVHITQIKDANTTCVYGYSEKYNICQGIKIDVEPLDGAPDNVFKQLIQTFFANLYGLFAAQRVPVHYQPTWKKVVARLVLPIFQYGSFCYRVFTFAEKQVKKYDVDNCDLVKWNFGAIHQIYKKSIFLPVSELEFEGVMRPVPNKYDEYLRLVYGDYHVLPQESKRHPITKVLAFDLNHGLNYYSKGNDSSSDSETIND